MAHPTPAELAARYDDPLRKSDRIRLSAERFERGIERGDDGGWGVGALVADSGRALFVREGETWLLPGGHLESGESPEAGAKREVYEETGVGVEITGLGAVAEQTFVHESTGDSYEFYFATFLAEPTEDAASANGGPSEESETGPHAPASEEEQIDAVEWFDSVPEATFDRELVAALFDTHV
jgi:ADP-ribose pyrophosphatase YjhB (NUDIX family)